MKIKKYIKKVKYFNFKAFTLVEILVVSTIIAFLAGGGFLSYSQINIQSRNAKRKSDLEQIRTALEIYRSNNNQYFPGSGTFSGNCQSINWLNLYLPSIPNDPRSPSFYYRCNISRSDYTLGAYLENGGVGNCGQCGNALCNYCVGPYGQR